MTNFLTKVLLLLLVAIAGATQKPHSLRGLRATPHAPQKKKRLNPIRSLENHATFHNKISKQHKTPLKLKPKPPHRHLEMDPALCQDATDLQLGETVEASFAGPEGIWYSVAGTGGYLAVSTCTGDATLDEDFVDTVIDVYSGDCDNGNFLTTDDDGGSCGLLRSRAVFESVVGEIYNVNVRPFWWDSDQAGLTFGVTVDETDDIPPTNTVCEEAALLELNDIVQLDASNFNGFWFSITGTGGILAVSTCPDGITSDAGAYFEVYSGSGCNDLEWEAYGSSSFDFCQVAYVKPSANEVIYVNAFGYIWDETSDTTFSLTVYEVDEIPNVVCEGATLVELGESVEGEISQAHGSAWYTFVGTGNDLVISTCTGNDQLDNAPFDSVINVHARDCDDLRWIASDDEGGKCGNGKSQIVLPSVEGLTYHVAVSEYYGMTGPFGLKVSAST